MTGSMLGAIAAGALMMAIGTQAGAAEEARTGTVEANGIAYAWRITGEGAPLLLLHGGLGSWDMFDPILPILNEGRQVIAVDLQGHGRTPLGDRPVRLPDIADDLAIVLGELGYESVDAMGYSFGSGAALRLAIQHPGLVDRLVLASAIFSDDGYYPEMRPQQAAVGAAMAEAMKETPMYRGYAAVAPHPEDFPRLLDAMGETMRQSFDWSADIEALEMPVMLVYGDADMIRLDHATAFYKLLGGGQRDAGWMREHLAKNRLAILPDLTHYEVFMSPLLAETAVRFLDGAAPPVWTGR